MTSDGFQGWTTGHEHGPFEDLVEVGYVHIDTQLSGTDGRADDVSANQHGICPEGEHLENVVFRTHAALRSSKELTIRDAALRFKAE